MLSTVFSLACGKCVTHTVQGPGAIVQVAFTEVIMIFDFAFRILNWKRNSGGYCGGVPPLPIPNREVKPTYADGTAMQCGRVGSRLL